MKWINRSLAGFLILFGAVFAAAGIWGSVPGVVIGGVGFAACGLYGLRENR